MNRQLKQIAIVLLTLSLLGAVSCSKPSDNSTNSNIDYWTCTMHPSVHSKAPGKCPICSMDLVPVMKRSSGASLASGGNMQGMAGMPGMEGGNQMAGGRSHEFVVPVERQQQI